ncbi:atp-dependent rna helicase dbp9 like protein [Zymoseptoria brevis]|uniref:RNA helicase n=1 Tax=Zymoseptoria brevis TaxID=1047168 RepID=A0A0F4G9T2_9PEZI|nr:atp-dependent rna helicase dbp9 like protein [Zymoseptoria brevis]
MKRKLNERDVPELSRVEKETSAKTQATPTDTTDTPATATTFSALNLDARLLQALTREKLTTPTPVQQQAIPLAIAAKHVLARAKTGSGKTLAYLLPILHAILARKASTTTSKKSKNVTSALILVPTRELAVQVAVTVKDFTTFCAGDIRCENITRKEDSAVTRARLAGAVPDIVIATPSRACQWINQEVLKVEDLRHLVIDEADLVLSYEYDEDLQSLATSLPTGVQKIMMSATLRAEVDTLTELFFGKEEGSGPTILDLSKEEAVEKATLAQFTVRTAEDEKFLLIYAIFKLQLITGKVIVFVADIDRCYRVKLFLEQFGIRSCVLNSELPVNSRLHVVEEFNRGVYDIIIAADEGEVIGNEESKGRRKKNNRKEAQQEDADFEDADEQPAVDVPPPFEDDEVEADSTSATVTTRPAKKQRRSQTDREYGVSRGIDFRGVTCVLNFDLPPTAKSYTHRIGRTARAGRTGMALSFHVPSELYRKHKPSTIPQCANDDQVLAEIISSQSQKGAEVKAWGLDWAKLDGFRYRLADALRSVTRIAVREARTKELRAELIKSEKLKRHFEENPDDLRHLRHDTESHAVRAQPHLKHVPEYLLPSGGKAAVSKDVGYVGIRRDKENRLRKARAVNKGKGRGRLAKGKGLDPLRSLNAKGRGKK